MVSEKKFSLAFVSCLLLYTSALFLPQKSHPWVAPASPSDPRGGFIQGSRLGVWGLSFILAPSGPSMCPGMSYTGCFVLFQMPVTFEDVALYLSREEWGRLDHTQQSFYHDVLQKRNRLALGKGWRLHWGGSFLRPWISEVGLIPMSPPCFPEIKTPHFI